MPGKASGAGSSGGVRRKPDKSARVLMVTPKFLRMGIMKTRKDKSDMIRIVFGKRYQLVATPVVVPVRRNNGFESSNLVF